MAVRGAPLIPITIAAADDSKVYAESDPTLVAEVTSGALASGHYLDDAQITREAGENVGTYDLTLTEITILDGDDGDADVTALYDITLGANANGFTIDPYPITVTPDAQGKTYGASDPSPLSWQTTSGTLQGGDDFTGTLTRQAGEAAGTYDILIGSLAIDDGNGGNNYDLTLDSEDFTITTRALTVTAANKSKIEGEADPALTYSITAGSLAFDDELTGSLTREAGEDPGAYDIQQGTLTVTSDPHAGNIANYNFTFNEGTFTIGVAPAAAGLGFSTAISIGIR